MSLLRGASLYQLMERHILTAEQQGLLGFPLLDPSAHGVATINPNHQFSVAMSRFGKLRPTEITGSHGSDLDFLVKLNGFVRMMSKTPPLDGCYGVYALACHMCVTTEGPEPTRVTVKWLQNSLRDIRHARQSHNQSQHEIHWSRREGFAKRQDYNPWRPSSFASKVRILVYICTLFILILVCFRWYTTRLWTPASYFRIPEDHSTKKLYGDCAATFCKKTSRTMVFSYDHFLSYVLFTDICSFDCSWESWQQRRSYCLYWIDDVENQANNDKLNN